MRRSAVFLTRWQDLKPVDQAAVLRLNVTEQQTEFAGTVERAVASLEGDEENNIEGLAICTDEEVVGFLVLKRRSKLPEWASPSAAVVSAMRIDQGHQGKGLGSSSLLALTEWVAINWPESSSLTLSVDEENILGMKAYAKAGFQDHGVRVQGRIGWVRYMSKSVAGTSSTSA